jgi:hypothetical protein
LWAPEYLKFKNLMAFKAKKNVSYITQFSDINSVPATMRYDLFSCARTWPLKDWPSIDDPMQRENQRLITKPLFVQVNRDADGAQTTTHPYAEGLPENPTVANAGTLNPAFSKGLTWEEVALVGPRSQFAYQRIESYETDPKGKAEDEETGSKVQTAILGGYLYGGMLESEWKEKQTWMVRVNS